MIPRIGTMELLVIAGIVLLIFGPKMIPRLFRGLGDAIRELRGIAKATTEELEEKKEG